MQPGAGQEHLLTLTRYIKLVYPNQERASQETPPRCEVGRPKKKIKANPVHTNQARLSQPQVLFALTKYKENKEKKN